MMVVRENFRDAEFAADVHRNAIGQTVAFVEARFVKFERVEKAHFASPDDFKFWIEQNFSDESRNLKSHSLAEFTVKIQEFD